MNKPIVRSFVAAVGTVCAVCSTAYALYEVTNTGTWPKSWPAELEPLRKRSRTLVGPLAPDRHYAIRFTKSEEFESTWLHILKVKAKGAPIFLKRGRNFFLGADCNSGVVVHCPPLNQAENPDTPEAQNPGATKERERETYATSIELIVDGAIVDLNRIPLPADTPIIDERFK
jgi:hypothetical protein